MENFLPQKVVLDITKLTDIVKTIKITDSQTNSLALERTKNIKRFSAFLKDISDKHIKPLKDEARRLEAILAPYKNQLIDSEKVLKAKMLEYSKIEAKMRLEAREKALKNIDPFDTKTDLTEYDKPKNEGMSIRQDKDIEIVDESIIPKEYWILDLKRIKADATRTVKPVAIPGVKVVIKESVAIRS
jgi:uncharacterized protein YfeS